MYTATSQAFARRLVAVACAAVAALACGDPQTPATGDGADGSTPNRVASPAPERNPPRIVSLGSEMSRLLIELDLERALVGLDRASFRQLGLAGCADVGDAQQPDLEAIAGLTPDLVFTLDASTRDLIAPKLAQRGVRIPRFDPKTANEIIETVHEIGIATGRQAESRALVRGWTGEIARIATRRDGAYRSRVIWVLAWEPVVIVGNRGLLHEILELAGGEMALHRLEGERVETTLAEIAASDPDLVLDSAPQRAPQRAGLGARLEVLPAGIDRLPTLELPERIRILHAAIYPSRPDESHPRTHSVEEMPGQ